MQHHKPIVLLRISVQSLLSILLFKIQTRINSGNRFYRRGQALPSSRLTSINELMQKTTNLHTVSAGVKYRGSGEYMEETRTKTVKRTAR